MAQAGCEYGEGPGDAALADVVYAFNYGVIAPLVMGLDQMTLLVTMLVVGGLGTVTGPIVGTPLMTVIPAQLD